MSSGSPFAPLAGALLFVLATACAAPRSGKDGARPTAVQETAHRPAPAASPPAPPLGRKPPAESGARAGAKAVHDDGAPASAPTPPAAPAPPATATADTSPPARAGRVTVEVLGVESAAGTVRLALFRSARGFPDRADSAFGRKLVKARPGTLRVVFDGVPAGPFAVSVHHDEDADGTMDAGLFGAPTEGYGFSRDAHAPFGPPDFAAARLVLGAGEHQIVRIHLRY